MKAVIAVVLCSLLLAGVALAAAIDGKWVSVRKMERDGQAFTITQTFDLKADGAKLTGTLTMSFGEKEFPAIEIKDGKLDGNKFSFTTTMSTPNGEFKSMYEGTIEGSVLKGTATREGGQGRPFEAQRK